MKPLVYLRHDWKFVTLLVISMLIFLHGQQTRRSEVDKGLAAAYTTCQVLHDTMESFKQARIARNEMTPFWADTYREALALTEKCAMP